MFHKIKSLIVIVMANRQVQPESMSSKSLKDYHLTLQIFPDYLKRWTDEIFLAGFLRPPQRRITQSCQAFEKENSTKEFDSIDFKECPCCGRSFLIKGSLLSPIKYNLCRRRGRRMKDTLVKSWIIYE